MCIYIFPIHQRLIEIIHTNWSPSSFWGLSLTPGLGKQKLLFCYSSGAEAARQQLHLLSGQWYTDRLSWCPVVQVQHGQHGLTGRVKLQVEKTWVYDLTLAMPFYLYNGKNHNVKVMSYLGNGEYKWRCLTRCFDLYCWLLFFLPVWTSQSNCVLLTVTPIESAALTRVRWSLYSGPPTALSEGRRHERRGALVFSSSLRVLPTRVRKLSPGLLRPLKENMLNVLWMWAMCFNTVWLCVLSNLLEVFYMYLLCMYVCMFVRVWLRLCSSQNPSTMWARILSMEPSHWPLAILWPSPMYPVPQF